jgi:hypothetical protein
MIFIQYYPVKVFSLFFYNIANTSINSAKYIVCKAFENYLDITAKYMNNCIRVVKIVADS